MPQLSPIMWTFFLVGGLFLFCVMSLLGEESGKGEGMKILKGEEFLMEW